MAHVDLIDSHCHFDDASFDQDRQTAWQRAQMAQVKRQIIPAITAEWWPRVRHICQAYPGLYPAYGLHPIYLDAHQPAHLQALTHWLQTEKSVAVGECGLDYYEKTLNSDKQREFFIAQLKIARDFDLPVIIHARRAVDEVSKYLRRIPGRGVVHSFAGSEQQANRLIDLGYYLSFGGPVTYPRANRLRKLVQKLPLERILLETDAPDQPLFNHQGQRNEPAYLPLVLQTLAELRQDSPENIAAVTTQNSVELFNLNGY